MLTRKMQLEDKFSVSDFMSVIDVDFIYAEKDGRLLLLNQDMYGAISPDIVESQKDLSRIVVINTATSVMEVYNIPKDEIDQAMLLMHM